MKRLLFLSSILLPGLLSAQLTITDSLNAAALTPLLEGFNVTISNLVINCPGAAFAEFDGVSEIPIGHGLVMTSGSADLVAGANTSSAHSGTNMAPGDADLDVLVSPNPTYDACVLEFDCVPLGDTLLFNFAFGSEEYLEFVGSAFNDVFAIWLSGPGFPIPTNVAAIPGGTTVSINNVNDVTNAAYYVNNEVPPGVNCALDGFTQNLTAFAVVTPGATYHFKVAIADVSDYIYDSAVLLEAFSFRSVMGVSTGLANASFNDGLVIRPFDNALELILPDGRSNMSGRILDATGRVVRQFQVTGVSIMLPTNDLRNGTYIVEVTDEQGSSRRSFYYDALGR